jgi:hypothetical protein
VCTTELGTLESALDCESLRQLLDSGDKQAFDQMFDEGMQPAPPAQRQNWEWRAKPYGLRSAFDVFTAARRYNLADVTDQITTPLLITDPGGEQFGPASHSSCSRNFAIPSNLSCSLLRRVPTGTASRWPDYFSSSACSTGWTRPSPASDRAPRGRRAVQTICGSGCPAIASSMRRRMAGYTLRVGRSDRSTHRAALVSVSSGRGSPEIGRA